MGAAGREERADWREHAGRRQREGGFELMLVAVSSEGRRSPVGVVVRGDKRDPVGCDTDWSPGMRSDRRQRLPRVDSLRGLAQTSCFFG